MPEQVVPAETFVPQFKQSGAWTFNVSVPTLTIFRPDPAKANGTALILCPGGAFHFLAMDTEGEPMARWLRDQGITVFLLKYRVLQTTLEHRMRLFAETAHVNPEVPAILPLELADARAALKYVRAHAADYGVEPNRVGMIGASAGAAITLSLVLDATDNTKPDFIGLLYTDLFDWMRPLVVPKSAPPAFIAVASDDQNGFASLNTEVYNAWIAAGRSAELHAYAAGGHGFGMLRQGLPVDTWIERFEDWLRSRNLLTQPQ